MLSSLKTTLLVWTGLGLSTILTAVFPASLGNTHRFLMPIIAIMPLQSVSCSTWTLVAPSWFSIHIRNNPSGLSSMTNLTMIMLSSWLPETMSLMLTRRLSLFGRPNQATVLLLFVWMVQRNSVEANLRITSFLEALPCRSLLLMHTPRMVKLNALFRLLNMAFRLCLLTQAS